MIASQGSRPLSTSLLSCEETRRRVSMQQLKVPL
jgi:hypothetical protein